MADENPGLELIARSSGSVYMTEASGRGTQRLILNTLTNGFVLSAGAVLPININDAYGRPFDYDEGWLYRSANCVGGANVALERGQAFPTDL